jgi:ribosomal protein S27E
MLQYYYFSSIIPSIKNMKAICPECKNEIDLTRYPMMKEGIVIECNVCGITLLVRRIDGENVETEIVDEGK